VIRGRTGAHRYRVEVARTERQQQIGMMFRRTVPKATGMLFPWNKGPASFWMRNTLVPLDIVYIGPDHRIESIVTAVPLDESPLPSRGPVLAVLELAGGEAKRAGFGVGDRVESPALRAAAKH
jgi:uncharacterized membrane protein (UPF0127 family)